MILVDIGGIVEITSHFNSLSDDQQFHQYQQTSPLTLAH
jgi:hypothetical protein